MGCCLGWFWLLGVTHRTERYLDWCLESVSVSPLSALLHWFVPGFEWDGRYVLVLVDDCAYVWC